MKSESRGWLLLVAALYAVVFLAWTWPLGAHLADGFPAMPHGDAAIYVWNVWHFREAVLAGSNPFYTNWLLYPQGASLVMHAYIPIVGLFNLLIGQELLAINLFLLLSYVLSGTGGYLLSRRWVRHPLLGWLAGLVFAYSPYKLLRLQGHYNLVLTATVPFFVLAFLRAFEWEDGWRWPRVKSWAAVGWCCALGLVTLLSDYYVLFGLLYFALAYALWFWLRLGQIRWQRPRTWLWLALGIVGSHVAIRLLRLAGPSDNGGFWWGGDVLGYLVPPAASRYLDVAWAARLHSSPAIFNTPGSIENVMFLGYTLPLLGLVLALWPGRPASARHLDAAGRPLAWVLLFFVLLTLPGLRFFGKDLLNLPTSILHFIPFFNNIRCPTRWVLLVSLLLPIVVFSALEAWWQPRLRRGPQWSFGLLLLGCVALEFWPKPTPVQYATELPAVYKAAAKLPGAAMLPLPVGLLDGHRQLGIVQPEIFFYQTRHRKKLPAAYFSRIAEERFREFEQDPVMRTLLALQQAPADTVAAPPLPAQAAAFRRHFGPALVVVHPDWRNGPAHRYLRLVFPDFTERTFPDGYVLLAPAAGK
ncbi:hypothetical protein E5K00_21655 [Hymenobacter aquaticus]|uniref:DUF6311 domain-containing protein n=1 Tax=Hymenobacter aquaticus TaxID=1867101 RepID=A0A4Z0PUN2_9BACT|nr:hypothetical protein [Hymenobacter aquaticus]TGE20603.1 hypothetical protein E5K00_21655 [Hymenobacter aquaticus]